MSFLPPHSIHCASAACASVVVPRKWSRNDLSYWAPDFMEARDLFPAALSRWSSVTPLRFSRSRSVSAADIVIHFAQIDGKNGILGQAYFPPVLGRPEKAKDGDIYLDLSDWADLSSNGRIEVLAHELGHALGLDHLPSHDDPLMGPAFRGPLGGELASADIKAIQNLYGLPATVSRAHCSK